MEGGHKLTGFDPNADARKAVEARGAFDCCRITGQCQPGRGDAGRPSSLRSCPTPDRWADGLVL